MKSSELCKKLKELESVETTQKPKKQLSCDEVAWLVAALRRLSFIAGLNYPAISRIKEMAVYSALYEIMEILHLDFQDEAARYNATPEKVRKVSEDKAGCDF
jgi:hypothetical protein